MKHLFLFIAIVFSISVNAQYIDESTVVEKSKSITELISELNKGSMYTLFELDRNIREGKANYSLDDLNEAVKSVDYVGEDFINIPTGKRIVYKVKIPGKSFLSNKQFKDSIVSEVAIDYQLLKNNNLVNADTINGRVFRLHSFDGPSFSKSSNFTMIDNKGIKYNFSNRAIDNFSTKIYRDSINSIIKELKGGIKPYDKYVEWNGKSDFSDWYVKIYNNESIRSKLNELKFISLKTGETVDGLNIVLGDKEVMVGDKNTSIKDSKLVKVNFNSTTNGGYDRLNIEWIPSNLIDLLNKNFIGLELIRPEYKSMRGQDKAESISTIKRFILTDKVDEHVGDDYMVIKGNKSDKVKLCLVAEMNSGEKVSISDIKVAKIQEIPTPYIHVYHDWLDNKVYQDILEQKRKYEEQLAKEAAESERINTQRKMKLIESLTPKYGNKIAVAIANGKIIPGMTLDIVRNELRRKTQIVSASAGTIMVVVGIDSNWDGVIDIITERLVINGNKITLVEPVGNQYLNEINIMFNSLTEDMLKCVK